MKTREEVSFFAKETPDPLAIVWEVKWFKSLSLVACDHRVSLPCVLPTAPVLGFGLCIGAFDLSLLVLVQNIVVPVAEGATVMFCQANSHGKQDLDVIHPL